MKSLSGALKGLRRRGAAVMRALYADEMSSAGGNPTPNVSSETAIAVPVKSSAGQVISMAELRAIDKATRPGETISTSQLSRHMPRKSLTTGQTFAPATLDKPISKDWTAEEGINDGFKSTHWVYACVMKIARAAASVPWYVETKSGGKWVRATDHELEGLIEYPNPFMSRQDMIERLACHLYLAGNGIWDKVRGGGMPIAELWPISPDQVFPVPNKMKFISHYQYRIGGEKPNIKPEDVVHFQFVDPATPLWGMSPMQAAADLIATEVDAVNWWRNSIANRTVADGMIKFKEVLTREQYDDVQDSIDEQRSGPEKARRTLIVGADADYVRFSMTPAEMDFMETRGMTRVDICAVFGVPPPMVGIYDNATLANLGVSRTIFWKDTVVPFLDDLRNHMNLSISPEYGKEPRRGIPTARLNYDLSEVEALQEDLAKKAETAKIFWSIGIPMVEINRRLEIGFPEKMEGADVGWVPSTVMPIGEAATLGGAGGSGAGKDLRDAVPVRELKAIGVTTDAKKKTYWRAFDRQRRPFENQMATRMRVLFGRQSEAVQMAVSRADAGRLEEAADDAIDEMAEVFSKAFLVTWRDVATHFGQAVARELGAKAMGDDDGETQTKGASKADGWDFDPWPEEAQRAARTFVGENIQKVGTVTKNKVRRVIAEAIEEGMSVPQVAGEIELLFSGFSRNRAHVIARTEVVGASNFGSREAARQSGLDPEREWLSSRDERVRDSHAPGTGVDGERVAKFNERYSNGLLFPGDPDGAAEEVIMCRCAETYSA